MRVMHLISSGGMYGAEAVILNLAHALHAPVGLQQGGDEGGDEGMVASFSNGSRHLHERALLQGVPAMLIPCRGVWSPETVVALRNAVLDHRVDVLHTHGYKADVYAWAALRAGQKPSGAALVSTCHTWYDNDWAVRLYGALDRLALRGYARVVAVSEEVEGRLLRSGVPPTRIRRIRNGTDVAQFAAIANARNNGGGCRVGLVGRLAPEKGVDLFLEAAAGVVAAMPNVRFTVMGDGPQREHLEAQVRRLGLGEHVRMPGWQASMAEVYAGMDVLVSASRQEGLPMALLEGMASGLPVVATAVGEVPLLVKPGATGLLVKAGDIAALQGAMLEVLQNRDARLEMGRNARELVKREFSVERMVADYRGIYREAMAGDRL